MWGQHVFFVRHYKEEWHRHAVFQHFYLLIYDHHYHYFLKEKATSTFQVISRIQALANLNGIVGGRYN